MVNNYLEKPFMRTCKIARHELYILFEDGRIHSGIHDIFLAPQVQENGYMLVTLGTEQLLVHRLVAKHFLPNPYDHPQVNHKDGNKANNQAGNLEWVSGAGNIQHALETGLIKGYIHVDVKRTLLARVLKGEIIADLAPEVGNHPNTLTRMLRVQATKDGLSAAWEQAMKTRRVNTALSNLEKINAQAVL
jgi:hypothetical protein